MTKPRRKRYKSKYLQWYDLLRRFHKQLPNPNDVWCARTRMAIETLDGVLYLVEEELVRAENEESES